MPTALTARVVFFSITAGTLAPQLRFRLFCILYLLPILNASLLLLLASTALN